MCKKNDNLENRLSSISTEKLLVLIFLAEKVLGCSICIIKKKSTGFDYCYS